jgi:prophage regulatory protein
MMKRIIRERALRNITQLSRTTRWRLERQNQFPKETKLSERAVGWSEDEVMQWLRQRVEAR